MIDFRYHLVSLISVFLALAVGIVLGAGPLREGIGESLTGQVEALRADRDALRTELEAAIVDVNDRDAWIGAMGEQAAAGRLDGRTVAVVALPGADDGDVAAVVDSLGVAGAQVSAAARLTDAWTTTDPTFRRTFAQQLAGYLDPAPAADASPEEVMALALAQTLRDWASADNPNPAILLELLRGGDQPFITLQDDPTSAVGSVVVVGPRPVPEAAEASPSPTAEPELDAAAIVGAVVGTLPTVTIGASDDLILQIREAGLPTSTIDSIGEVPATVSVPFALAAELGGQHGRYGFAASANRPVPPLVDLAAPVEVPAGEDQG